MLHKQRHVVNPDDLTRSALKRLVAELLVANDGQAKKLLEQLSPEEKDSADEAHKESNDLADLVEEKRGKPGKISPDGDQSSQEPDGDPDDELYAKKSKPKRGMK